MTGIELIRRARSLQPDLPAVLITGCTDAIDPGASTLPVLAKPFRAAELARALAEAFKRSTAM
jgi:CheY-like chemotaxis protein